MKRVPIILVFVEKLPGRQFSQADMKVVNVQIRNSHTYSDLKKRISDCINQLLQGSAYKTEQLRLWSVQSGEGSKLKEGLNKVAASLKDNTPMR